MAQNKNIESVTLSPSSLSDSVEKISMFGPTDWVAVRNKYFVSSLVSDDASGGFVEGRAAFFQEGLFVPQYTMGLNFNKSSFSVQQFFVTKVLLTKFLSEHEGHVREGPHCNSDSVSCGCDTPPAHSPLYVICTGRHAGGLYSEHHVP